MKFGIKSGLFKNLKIRTKLIIIYSALIILSITSVTYLTLINSHKVIINQSKKYTLGILEQINDSINMKLEQIDATSKMIITNNLMLETLQNADNSIAYDADIRGNIDSLLNSVMISRNDIDSIYVFDKAGNNYGTVPLYENIDVPQLFKVAGNGNYNFVWLKLNSLGDHSSRVISAVRLVYGYYLKPIGAILFNIKLKSFQSAFSSQISNMNGHVYLVNNDDEIISSIDNKDIGKKLDKSIIAGVKTKGDYFEYKVNDVNCLITVYYSKWNQWRYISVIPMSELTKDSEYVSKVNVIAAIFIIIIFVLISFVIARSLTEPINLITKKMKKVSINDKMPKIHYTGNDEFAYLTDAFNDMVIRIDTLVKEVYEQNLLRSEQEFKNLQVQINPHFLYNTLEVVNWIARTKGVIEIAEIVKALSDMMRYSISKGEDVVTIESELNHIKNYFTIQSFRYGNKLNIMYNIEEDILDMNILKLTLQPIVENSLIHGIDPKGGNGTIQIIGKKCEDKACIKIIDDGVGITRQRLTDIRNDTVKDDTKKHSNIGIKNVDKRLQIKFGKQYGVEINSEEGLGTTVEIFIPLS